MRLRAIAALLLFFTACATSAPSPGERASRNPRIANLQRAATLPWTDGGRCVVREASQPWPVLAERCFPVLDHDRVRFNDPKRRCAVASAGTAALGFGLCVLAAPEIVAGAVIVLGVVVVGVVIKEALDAHELSGSSLDEEEPSLQMKPAQQESSANRKPKPEPSGQDGFPPVPTEPWERERRPECSPIPVPHRGGSDPHNDCADFLPQNSFPGWDVLVNGKQFDALVLVTRTLWDVKTDNFDIHSLRSQRFFVKVKLPEIQREKRLAEACGYHFIVGVRSATHKAALLELEPSLTVVVMDWC